MDRPLPDFAGLSSPAEAGPTGSIRATASKECQRDTPRPQPPALRLYLLRKLRAGLRLLSPILHALFVVHRSLADDLGEHEIGDVVNFPILQGGRRIRHALPGLSQVGLLEAVAAAVAVCELVERRHASAGQAAFDGHD